MPISKQEFYEGSAIFTLIRSNTINNISYLPPFFIIDKKIALFLKYSTKCRSPWFFTFSATEQKDLQDTFHNIKVFIGFICGSDGIAAISYNEFIIVARPSNSSIHISCFRKHKEYYEINGPSGTLPKKIPPSYWRNIMKSEEAI